MHRAIMIGVGALALCAAGGAVAMQSAGWAGTYDAAFAGGPGTVTVKGPNRAGYQYEVTLRRTGGHCTGEEYGGGTATATALTAIIPVGDTASGWQECRITLTRAGGGLRITESKQCAGLHESGCAFTGSATREGASASAGTAPAPAAGDTPITPAFLVGGWVADPRNCDGDGGTVYKEDGAWFEGDYTGRWSVTGDRLTTTAIETSNMGENIKRLRPPIVTHWTLTRVGKNRLTYVGNGKRYTLVRCP